VPVAVAGGVESISLVQGNLNQHRFTEEWLMRHKPALWTPMIETADIVAERRGLEPLGIFRGFAVAGCEPDEMGIGPVFAVPRLLQRHGLRVPFNALVYPMSGAVWAASNSR
jgi:acetyl-CoA acetyltransferase